jgi:hypothetical protein
MGDGINAPGGNLLIATWEMRQVPMQQAFFHITYLATFIHIKNI